MKMQAFNAKCPLEIGDKVIVKKEGSGKTAYYIPSNAMAKPEVWRELFQNGTECVITDIAVVHFCRSGQIQFQYELDNSGTYEMLIVKIPVTRISDELERRRR